MATFTIIKEAVTTRGILTFIEMVDNPCGTSYHFDVTGESGESMSITLIGLSIEAPTYTGELNGVSFGAFVYNFISSGTDELVVNMFNTFYIGSTTLTVTATNNTTTETDNYITERISTGTPC